MAKESSDIRDVLEELGRRPARLHRVRLPGRREHPRGRRPGPPPGHRREREDRLKRVCAFDFPLTESGAKAAQTPWRSFAEGHEAQHLRILSVFSFFY